ncbi:acyl-ACP desaturase [Nocardia sp. CDC159]|uniref:Acyl-ACP desaturase n=1 Tax=Nocardia pulmonis TaxID=2951408 RepID=A0A9X2E2Z2_9NOCA|nr:MULTISPECIES: acyl-ACP desaturase [Nocardia]MCM6772143.1 acyl-ACP desaturase [Nocardia pulmonis]MCM6785199.1 acyl-ACP desaturase [Nocardia sp. CDC159]
MTAALTDLGLLRELEPVAERHLDDHLRQAKAWHPHDYVPWGDGRNFAALGGIDWEPGQSRTRISHRNTGTACAEPVAERMLQRIATDENLHMVFYRNISAAALDLPPDAMLRAITEVVTRFQMPGLTQPNFRRDAVLLAEHGSYDVRQHLDGVLRPVLRAWNVFERTDLRGDGVRARDELGCYLDELAAQARRFEEGRERAPAREAARAERAGTA